MTSNSAHHTDARQSSVEDYLGRALLAALLGLAVRGLEWVGRTVERAGPPCGGAPEFTFWRVHGWPF